MASPIKIAYFIGSMRRGGAEGQVVQLLRHFSRHPDYEPVLYLLKAAGDHLDAVRELGVPVRDFVHEHPHPLYDPRTFLHVSSTATRIGRALREDRPDIFHCFLYWANVLGAWGARRAETPMPVVASRRSLGDFKDGRPWMQWIENWTNRMVTAVTVNSRAVAADVARRERIDPAKIHLLYNGVDIPDRVSEVERARLRKHFGLDPEKPADRDAKLIVCVANLIHYKGHLTLLEAMARVRRETAGFRLLLAGRDGGMEQAVRARIAEFGLGGQVRLLGPVQNVQELYQACDLVVHPSNEEGFSNVILEAMAAGRPLAATRVGGIPEAIEDEREGLLVEPRDPAALADAILKLTHNDEMRRRMGEAARARAERDFSLAAMFANYEKFYAHLLGAETAPSVADAESELA